MNTNTDIKQLTPESSPVEIKVAIVEDQRNFREYLAAPVDESEGFRCSGN